MSVKEKEKPFKFESEEQLLYIATCMAASNLGFCILDNTWQGPNNWIKYVKEQKGYSSKTNCIVQAITSLGDEECDLYNGILSERKIWVKHLKKYGFFNKDVEEYIKLAQ